MCMAKWQSVYRLHSRINPVKWTVNIGLPLQTIIAKYVPGAVVNGKREMRDTATSENCQPDLLMPQKRRANICELFRRTRPMTKEEMEEEVNQIMFDITNPYLCRIVHNI